MADNVVLNSGSGGVTAAADDVGGFLHQRVKLSVGADGSASDAVPVSAGLDTTGSAVQAVGLVAQLDDTATASVTENQFAPVRLSSRRALLVEGVASGTVIPVSDGGGAITVDGTVGVSGTVTVDGSGVTQPISHAALTELAAAIDTEVQCDIVGALPAGTNNIGDVDVLSIAAGDNNIGNVDIVTMPAVTNAGTFAVQVDGAALTALQLIDDPVATLGTTTYSEATTKGMIVGAVRRDADTTLVDTTNEVGPLQMDANGRLKVEAFSGETLPVSLAAGTNTNEVVGDIAHDTGVGGNPVQIAGAAQDMDDTAPPNRVSAESDVTRLATDRDGALFVHPHGPQVWSYHLDTSSAQTDATVHAAPGSGLSLYVTDIVFSSGSATAINLFFEEGASKVLGPYYLEAVAGRGMAIRFATPKKITANTALTLTTSASIAHAVDVTGFVAQG